MQKVVVFSHLKGFLLNMFEGGEGGTGKVRERQLHFNLWSEHQVREFNIYFLKSQGEILLKCGTNPVFYEIWLL